MDSNFINIDDKIIIIILINYLPSINNYSTRFNIVQKIYFLKSVTYLWHVVVVEGFFPQVSVTKSIYPAVLASWSCLAMSWVNHYLLCLHQKCFLVFYFKVPVTLSSSTRFFVLIESASWSHCLIPLLTVGQGALTLEKNHNLSSKCPAQWVRAWHVLAGEYN